MTDDEIKKYGLAVRFEQWCAEMAAARPTFWGRCGHEVDPDRLTCPASTLVFRACHSIAADGRPPTKPVIVLQRLQRWHQKGDLDADELADAADLLEAAEEDADGFDEDAVVDELAPVLQQFVKRQAAEAVVQHYSKTGDMTQVEKLLARAKRIGVSDVSVGTRLGSATVGAIRDNANLVRLPTGVEELDAELRGGPKRATLTVVTGGPKSGKSMFIDQQVAAAISMCVPSAIATMELEEDDHHARVMANLIDLETDDILEYPDVAEEATARMRVLEEDGLLSFCAMKWFAQHTATVADLDRWLTCEEQTYGVKIRLLGVDYYQLLAAEKSQARHEELSTIAKELFNLAKKRDMWITTGNQATGEGMNTKKVKVLDNVHSGESKGITRICDLHVTINNRDDMESILWHVAGNRYGPTGGSVGPIPVEFEKGRVAPAIRLGWPF